MFSNEIFVESKRQKKKPPTDPELRINVTKSIFVIIPPSVEVNRTIHPSLYHLKEAHKPYKDW